MPLDEPPEKARVRRVHTKSRHGCRNCKLRRVKCDEAKPQCRKCRSFGFDCNYLASGGPDLRMAQEMEVPPPVSNDATATFVLDHAAWKRLQWFGWAGTGTSIFNVPPDAIVRLALQRPYLMHAMLGVAALHQRQHDPFRSGPQSAVEAYHAAEGAKLLNKLLQHPIQPHDRDAIWTTATFLGIVTVASPSSCTSDRSWPLRLDASSDLDWLRMTRSKRSVWKLTTPLRENSLFHTMTQEYAEMFQVDPNTRYSDIPRWLAELCGLGLASTAESNPYYTAVYTLSPLLTRPIESLTRSRVLAFSSQMTLSFEDLLRSRDAVALVLLALWYRVARRVLWWSQPRAGVELASIALYLKQHDPQGGEVQELL